MSTIYYSSIDNSTWTTPDGAGTKITYNGVLSNRASLLASQSILSGIVLPKINASNLTLEAAMSGAALENKENWGLTGSAYNNIQVKAILPARIDTYDPGNYYRIRQVVATSVGISPFDPKYPAPGGTNTVSISQSAYDESVLAIDAIINNINSPDWGTDPQLGLSTLSTSEDGWHVWWIADPQYADTVNTTSVGNPLSVSWTNHNEDAAIFSIDLMAFCQTHGVWWQDGTDMVGLAGSATSLSTVNSHGTSGHTNSKLVIIVYVTSSKRHVWSEEFTLA